MQPYNYDVTCENLMTWQKIENNVKTQTHNQVYYLDMFENQPIHLQYYKSNSYIAKTVI